MKYGKIVGILTLTALASASDAWGWGSYGHQQVNVAAVELLNEKMPDSPMAKCVKAIQPMIQRLAITPDYDWKQLGNEIDENYVVVPLTEKKNPDGTRNPNHHSVDPRSHGPNSPDQYEHTLHYFEADAFFADPGKLPANDPKYSGDYTAEVQNAYIALRSDPARIAEITKIDPAKGAAAPGIDAVRAHGTSPWRIKQLFALGVQNIKSGNAELAMIYLGAMGHYLGDMSQPFHTSLDFDGQYDPKAPPGPVLSSGIHAAFEAEMFVQIVAAPDKATFLFPDFSKTDSQVIQSANAILKGGNLALIEEARIIPEVLTLVSSSPQYVQPLLDALYREASANPVGAHASSARAAHAKAAAPAGRSVASLNLTVLQLAEQRISQSAILAAELWASAYAQAGSPGEFKCVDAKGKPFEFDRKKAVTSYVLPLFLPEGHLKNPPSHPAARTDTTALPDETPDLPTDTGTGKKTITKSGAKTPLKPSAAAVRAFTDEEL